MSTVPFHTHTFEIPDTLEAFLPPDVQADLDNAVTIANTRLEKGQNLADVSDPAISRNNIGSASALDASSLEEIFTAVGNGTADDAVFLIAGLASGRPVVGRAGQAYRTTQLLGTAAANTALNLRSGKIIIDRIDASANPQMTLARFSSATIEMAAGRGGNGGVRRGVSAQAGAIFRDVTFRSVDQMNEGVDAGAGVVTANQDGFLLVLGAGALFDNIAFENIDKCIRVAAGELKIFGPTFRNMKRGIHFETPVSRIHVIGGRWIGVSPNATTSPGQNAMVGAPSLILIDDCIIDATGEHGIYFASNTGAGGTGIFVRNTHFLATGQCGFKFRSYRVVVVEGCTSQDCAYSSSTGTNEDNFHFEWCDVVRVRNVSGLKSVKGNCGNDGVYLSGCVDVEIDGADFDTPLRAGVTIENAVNQGLSPTEGPDRGCADIRARRVTVKGGMGLSIIHSGAEIGAVDVELDVYDCPGAPVSISVGTITAGKQIKVTGRWSGSTVWTPPNNAQIDMSGFLPRAREASATASATTSVGHIAAEVVRLTSSANISSLGPGAKGWRRRVIAEGIAFNLTAGANILLPATQNVPSGECANVICEGGSVWRVESITNGAGVERPFKVTLAVLATVSAATYSGQYMTVTDGVSGKSLVYSNGTNWKYMDGVTA